MVFTMACSSSTLLMIRGMTPVAALAASMLEEEAAPEDSQMSGEVSVLQQYYGQLQLLFWSSFWLRRFLCRGSICDSVNVAEHVTLHDVMLVSMRFVVAYTELLFHFPILLPEL